MEMRKEEDEGKEIRTEGSAFQFFSLELLLIADRSGDVPSRESGGTA